jgi:toxin YoeB
MCRGTAMVKWRLFFTKHALKDSNKLIEAGLKDNADEIIEILREDPYKSPPKFEKLVGDLKGVYSRRINIKHRIIYQIYDDEKSVKIIRMWSHYD